MSHTALGPTYSPTTTNSTARRYLCVTSWRIKTYDNSMFHFEKELLILKQECFREISGFYNRIVQVFTLPGFYASLVGISLLAFRGIISIPPTRNKQSKKLDCLTPWPVKMGLTGSTETSVNTHRATLRKTQKSVEFKHDFNIWRRSVQHMYHKNKVQVDNEGAFWVRIPSTNIISLPPPMIKNPTAC